jgi:uncharacterized protein YfaQ (DUF2300 family)
VGDHGDLVLGGITNQSLVVAVTLVVSDDLYTAVSQLEEEAKKNLDQYLQQNGAVAYVKLTHKSYPNRFR